MRPYFEMEISKKDVKLTVKEGWKEALGILRACEDSEFEVEEILVLLRGSYNEAFSILKMHKG